MKKFSVPMVLFLFSCSTDSLDAIEVLKHEMSGLDLEAPEQDAARDFTAGKIRCFSVNGFSRYFPGVEENDGAYCKGREINFKGTTDVVEGSAHMKMVLSATKYAKVYNIYVVSQLKNEF